MFEVALMSFKCRIEGTYIRTVYSRLDASFICVLDGLKAGKATEDNLVLTN